MTRRSDNLLREAISGIETLLLSEPDTNLVLSRCLSQLMGLLGAQFAYVYRCNDAVGMEEIPWEFGLAYSMESGVAKQMLNTSTSCAIPQSMQPKFLGGRCIHFDEAPEALPHKHPPINNCLALPLIDARRIYAVMFLCNSIAGFRPDTETRLRPFIAAASCLLRSSEEKTRFQSKNNNTKNLRDDPAMLLGLLDTMFNGVLIVNEKDNIALCNTAAASILCAPRRDIIGASVWTYFPKGIPNPQLRMEGKKSSYVEPNEQSKRIWRGVAVRTTVGDKVLIDLSSFQLKHGDELLQGLVMDDLSERLRSASDYQATLQRFQALTNLVPVAIVQLNRDWECTYANDTWCEYTQMTPDDSLGIGWLKGLHNSDADLALVALRQETAVNGCFQTELRLQSPLGKITWVKLTASALYSEDGDMTGLIMTFSDITTHLNNERRLQDIAEKDQLTGLINRAFFNDRLETALRGVERYGSVALMFIDLDEFKHINDTLGHDAGDTLLRDIAARLKETLRQADTIARIGGDEFTVILTNVQNTLSITAIADKLLLAMRDPVMLGERSIYVSCSIGISVADHEGTSVKQLLKQADAALYKAKKAGRDQYRFYTKELDNNANIHILLRESLKQKQRRDFRVVYQPQVDASTNKITGLEALTRWSRDDIKDIGADVFIKMIEESGLITDFSEWLFEEVFSTVKHWQKLGMRGVKVSVNVSAKQFRDKELARYILVRCRAHGVNPSSIVLEITETAIIDDPKIAADTLKMLRTMGFGVALDDFGTGYSSLAHLRDMPLQCVKIDRSFIKDILHDQGDAKIVLAILSLAKTLKLDVIAEGVDNSDVVSWLVDHGCLIHQGFYFHKPLEQNEIEALLDFNNDKGKVVPIDKDVG